MPCIRIPLGQPIPDDPRTGKPQTGSHNPLDCGCPICPALYYCETGNCDSECADDSQANMPCDLAALDSCTGKTSYPSEAECVQACVTIPPCCADPANCTQQIQYFDIKADAETFCSNIHAIRPETIEFEGIGGYCEVRKAVQGGVVKWASAYCLPVNHPGCLCSYTCKDVVDGVGTWELQQCERGLCENGTLTPPPMEVPCDEAGKFGTGSCSDCGPTGLLYCCDGELQGFFCGERVNVPGIGEMIGDAPIDTCTGGVVQVGNCSECGTAVNCTGTATWIWLADHWELDTTSCKPTDKCVHGPAPDRPGAYADETVPVSCIPK